MPESNYPIIQPSVIRRLCTLAGRRWFDRRPKWNYAVTIKGPGAQGGRLGEGPAPAIAPYRAPRSLGERRHFHPPVWTHDRTFEGALGPGQSPGAIDHTCDPPRGRRARSLQSGTKK